MDGAKIEMDLTFLDSLPVLLVMTIWTLKEIVVSKAFGRVGLNMKVLREVKLPGCTTCIMRMNDYQERSFQVLLFSVCVTLRIEHHRKRTTEF